MESKLVDSLKKYNDIYQLSISDNGRKEFWANEADDINWFEKFTEENILDSSEISFSRWFKDGKMNICYNCVDRHIENGRGDSLSIIWESAYLNKEINYTYKDLFISVNKLSKVLLDSGVKSGDTIIIYMPMIAESLFAMLACSRIGAIHSVVFGGFAAAELAERIKDAKPKMILTAGFGIEPRKHIAYYTIVNDAIKISKINGIKILLVQRFEIANVKTEEYPEQHQNTLIYQEEIDKIANDIFIPCEPVLSTHPLYILYTSGTTGIPKGIVRDHGGTCVAVNFTMKNIMNVGYQDVVLSTSDIGWVVGHTFIVYGPLIRGATTILFEGKPVGTPDCGKVWGLISKHKVKAFYTSPTALRAIKREDYDYKEMHKYDLSSLESVHMAGERCDPDTNIWLGKGIGEKKLINDQWWQTETGWPICCNNLNIHRFDLIPGSACRPLPGYDIRILDEKTDEEIIKPNKLGKICCKLPMPPSFMLTLWGNDNAFIAKYISNDKKYYISGDCGYFDNDGNIYIMTRTDDMIKIAGHRLSTGRMEEVLTNISEVSEAAVVSVKDDLKGELPFAFLICRGNVEITNPSVVKRIRDLAFEKIVNEIGAIARLKGVLLCNRLPKTRSGKIIRGLLKNIINGDELKIPPTIEDINVVHEIIESLKNI